jgi:hypothetical protein
MEHMLTTTMQTCARLLREMGKQGDPDPVLSQQGVASSSRGNLLVPMVWLEHNAAIRATVEGVWRAHHRWGYCRSWLRSSAGSGSCWVRGLRCRDCKEGGQPTASPTWGICC